MTSKQLTPKQERFVQEYLLSGNATEAYKKAYTTGKMKPATINRNAKANLDNNKISTRIRQLRTAMAKRAEIDQDRLTQEYARIAFADFRQFFNEDGNIIPIKDLSDDAAAVLAGVDVQMIGNGDDVSYVRKFKTWDKLKALNDLAKHLGFFREDNEQTKPSFIGIQVDPRVADMLNNPDEYTPPVDE